MAARAAKSQRDQAAPGLGGPECGITERAKLLRIHDPAEITFTGGWQRAGGGCLELARGAACGLALAGLSMAACGASGHPSPAATSPAATPAGATPSPVSTNTALPVAATKAQLDAWAAGPGFTAFKSALCAAGAVATAM